MRLSEERIKQAILHPEEEPRIIALRYFTDALSKDETIMPLVIQAVEKYGRKNSFRILRTAERIAQTPLTIQWLMNELRRDFDIKDVKEDNYRFAIAILLYESDPGLLIERKEEILAMPSFPDQLKGLLDDRLSMHSWDWRKGWEQLEEWGQDTMNREEITQKDSRRAAQLVKALARHQDEGADPIFELLDRQYSREDRLLMEWLEPRIVELAGEMRLEEAIPDLMRRLDEGYDVVIDEVGSALTKIGTDEVIQAVARKWRRRRTKWRMAVMDPLGHIHSDLAAESCLIFLARERKLDVQVALGNSLLSQFCADTLELVHKMVLIDEKKLDPEQLDLRWKLVAICTIMDMSFPEYKEWHRKALKTNYGWGERSYERIRLADSFRDPPEDLEED